MSLVTDEIRASASEIYYGHDICAVKSKQLLAEVGLPNGLLPLQDIEECGYARDTGFVWLIQKKKCEHRFEKIGKPVQYASEVTAYVEPNRIKKLTGVKTKELLLWITLCEIYVDDPPTGKITFKTPAGLFRSYPVSAFQMEESVPEVEVKDKDETVNGDEAGERSVDGAGDCKEEVKEVKAGEDERVEGDGLKEEAKEVEDKKQEEEVKEVMKDKIDAINAASAVEVKEAV